MYDWQTVQTLIKLLLLQFDLSLHCLLMIASLNIQKKYDKVLVYKLVPNQLIYLYFTIFINEN